MNEQTPQEPQLQASPPEARLFHKTVKGGYWVVATRVLSQLLFTIKFIIVLRLLEVDDIGLLGIASLIIATLQSFTNTGFETSLIQRKGEIDSYLDTAWSLGIFRGIVLYAIIFFAAPFLAQLKVPPDKVAVTINIVRVIGLSLLIGPLGNIGRIYFTKELQFKKSFILRTWSVSIDFVVTVLAAFALKSVWAVVWGKIAGLLAGLLAGYLMHPYRPSLGFDKVKASRMWNFGKWVMGINMIGFLMTQGDDYFVWAYLGIFALGYYQTAYKSASIPATQITTVVSQISFPAFAKIQDDIPRLRKAYLKIFQLTSFMAFPCAGFIFIFSYDFVVLIIGSKWAPIVPVLQILAIKGLERSLGSTRGPLFSAVGKPGIATKLRLAKLIMLIILIYPFSKLWGITGTAWVIVLIGLFAQPFGLLLAKKILKCNIMDLITPAILPSIATLVMIDVVAVLKCFVFQEIGFLSFGILSFIAIGCYLLVIFIGDHLVQDGIVDIIKEQFVLFRKMLPGRK